MTATPRLRVAVERVLALPLVRAALSIERFECGVDAGLDFVLSADRSWALRRGQWSSREPARTAA